MTEEQNSRIKQLQKKYNFAATCDEATVNYILLLFGIGYDMSEEEIEAYLFDKTKKKLIDKDLCRIAMLFKLPAPGEEMAPKEYIQTVVAEQKKREELCNRYESLFAKLGVTLEELEKEEHIRITFAKESEQSRYAEIKKLILEENNFTAPQLDEITKAIKLQIPEKEILHFATPDKTQLQMARYIQFYQLEQGKKEREQQIKQGTFKKWIERVKKHE